MSTKGVVLALAAAVTLGAQIFSPAVGDNPPVTSELPAPAGVRRILRRSCYDCHSNETRWPWYSQVAPVSWLVIADVHEARARMNFSSWPESAPALDCYLERRIAERAESGEMPPARYRWLHPSAAVTEQESRLLREWAAETCAE